MVGYQREDRGAEQRLRMEDGFSSYSSLYDTSSLLQFCNGKTKLTLHILPSLSTMNCMLLSGFDMSPADWCDLTPCRGVRCCRHELGFFSKTITFSIIV